jgi:acetate kinase
MEGDHELNEIKWKIAALEAKNEMLDGKLENLELKARIVILEAAKKKKEEEESNKLEELEKRVESCEKKNQLLREILGKMIAKDGQAGLGIF